jgi:hypothetical protein
MWAKLTPGVNFINVYMCIFHTKFWRQSQNVPRKKDIRTKRAQKAHRKRCKKLTPERFQSDNSAV